MTRTISLGQCVLSVMIIMAIRLPALADVTVEGTTYEMKSDGRYVPLGGVQIQAYRDDVPLLVNASVSRDKDGKFSFIVKEGEPFKVLFHGDKVVPQLTMLAGISNGHDVVQIALYSREQYEKSKLAKSVPLNEKIACLVKELPRDDRATNAIVRQFAK